MGLLNIFKTASSATDKAKEGFGVEPITSEAMKRWVEECVSIYQGNPCWINTDDNIDTINFAKSVCSETARLATLAIGIRVDGSARAEWLQQQIDNIYSQLRQWVEYGCAYGTIILKPSGNGIDLYTPAECEVTSGKDGKITGVVFHDWEKQGKKWLTRLEYHRFEGNTYVITNKCYKGDAPDDTKQAISIENTPWANMSEETYIANLSEPLFGVLKMPQANNIDMNSPCGLPIFSEAIQELRDLDIAYSRNANEIQDSKRTVLLDADRLIPQKNSLKYPNALGHSNMPPYVAIVDGDTAGTDIYHEINPSMNTDVRLSGINALLSQIGYKVGFSNGYFVFNEKGGIQTATGVEADQQRTIQFIKDVREQIQACLDSLIYALNAFADLYGLAPAGAYEVVYDFGDITYNREEDRARWWGYVVAGKVPAWKFFVKFEGIPEEEAKAMVEEATPKMPSLFGTEE